MRMPASGIGTFDANDEVYPGRPMARCADACDRRRRARQRVFVASTDRTPHFRDMRQDSNAPAASARTMGFDGKQCIPIPSQLATANAAFSPTEDEIAHARRVIDAYETGVAAGRGAVSLDGKMIDEVFANVRMARVWC